MLILVYMCLINIFLQLITCKWHCHGLYNHSLDVKIPCDSNILYIYVLQVGRVIEHTDATILLVFLTVYGLSTIMQCFLITTFFNKSNLCACCASFIYFALYLPYLLARHWEHLMSLDQKLAIVSYDYSNVNMIVIIWLLGLKQVTHPFTIL